MATPDDKAGDNTRIGKTSARQGDGSRMNARVLLFSLALIAVIGAGAILWMSVFAGM